MWESRAAVLINVCCTQVYKINPLSNWQSRRCLSSITTHTEIKGVSGQTGYSGAVTRIHTASGCFAAASGVVDQHQFGHQRLLLDTHSCYKLFIALGDKKKKKKRKEGFWNCSFCFCCPKSKICHFNILYCV